MTDRHVEELFSLAHDGELEDRERRRFDEHMAGCAACTSAYAQYEAVLGTLRPLAAVRMPVAVRLPEGRPRAAGVRALWADRARTALRPSAAWGVAGGALAIAASFVLLIHVGKSSGSTAMSGLGPSVGAQPDSLGGGRPAMPEPVPSRDPAGGAAAAAAPLVITVGCPVSGPTPTAVATSAFPDSVTVTDPARPGQRLTLATSANHYAAGASVPLYTVLIVPGASGPKAYGACTVGMGSTPAATGAAAPTTGHLSLDGVPVPQITLPAELAPGTRVVISAQVPAGVPSAGAPLLEARLTLVID